jgi:hypothetical protein
MSLFVHPDPQEPAGGFAFLELPEGTLTEPTATVAVFDAFGERWLATSEMLGDRIEVGDANWQSDRVEFGPYEVHRHDGADWVRIGPEIVNKIEEYAPLRLVVSGHPYDVTWPDTVPPRAGAAVLGSLQTVARKEAPPGPERLVGKAPPVEPPQAPPEPESAPVPEDEAVPSRKGSLLLPLALLLVALAAGTAWYFWPESGDQGQAPPPPVPESDPCSFASLSALSGGFPVTADALRDCGAAVGPDTALRLVEDAAARNDGAALLLFGTLYDGEALDARIEDVIGLTFEDDPAKAVEYYDRALRAGAAEAAGPKAATCTRLARSDATLAKGAHDDFCVE